VRLSLYSEISCINKIYTSDVSKTVSLSSQTIVMSGTNLSVVSNGSQFPLASRPAVYVAVFQSFLYEGREFTASGLRKPITRLFQQFRRYHAQVRNRELSHLKVT
jgi:hypothetical protein